MHDTHGFAHPHRNIAALGIEPGMTVVDFGSGSGAYVLAAAEALGGSGRVYAVDIQKDLLRRTKNEASRRGLHTVDVLWADLEIPGATKIKDAHVDRVIISNLLFQVPDTTAVMTEARRITRPHGLVAVIDWSDSFGGMGPRTKDVVPRETAIAIAQANGFELEREFPAGAHHYGLLFRPALHSTH